MSKKKVEEIYDQWTDERHIREKDMYLGTKDVIEKTEFIYDEKNNVINKENVKISIASRTCIDEILVNAIDHKTRNPDTVSQIRVTFDKSNGEISILNDGPGIPIEIHPKHNIYIPEMVATNTKSGSNLEKDISNEITGGTNGYGMTLTIICSEYSSITTITDECSNNKLTELSKFYTQNYKIEVTGKEPKLIKENPTILIGDKNIKSFLSKNEKQSKLLADSNYINCSFTKVCFKLDYKLMGYEVNNKNIPNSKDMDTIEKIIMQRLIQTSVFINSGKPAKVKNCNIYYNNNLISITSLSEYASLFKTNFLEKSFQKTETNNKTETNETNNEIETKFKSEGLNLTLLPKNLVSSIIKSETSEYVWEICVIPYNDGTGMNQISLINGIYPYNGGTHIDFIKKQITDKLSEKLKKEFKDMERIKTSNISDNIFIFMKACIVNPKWGEQRKSELQSKKSAYNGYELPPKFLNNIWEMMKDVLKNEFIQNITPVTVKVKTKSVDKKKKYDPAEYAGTVQGLLCRLWIPEGDSAETCINKGISDPKSKLGKEYNGIFNIGGVTVNARKETTKFEKINKDKSVTTVYTKTDKLKETERLNSLVEVLGLDYNKSYDLTELGDTEYKTLRYGCIILAVDQDLDGLGFIASNIMSFIHLFWPKLYNRGFVKRFATPLIKVFPYDTEQKVISFYSEKDYNKWKLQFENGEVPVTKSKTGFEIRYFKGLASHEKASIPAMFRPETFEKCLITYCLDSESDRLFDEYFGKDSDIRKDILSVPVDYDKYDINNYIQLNHKNIKINKKSIFDILTTIKNKTKIYGGMMEMVEIIQTDSTKVDSNVDSRTNLGNSAFESTKNSTFESDKSSASAELPKSTLVDLSADSVVSVSRHLQIETKEFQLDNVDRKISHAIDGLNPSKRKAFAGARKKLNNANKALKVFQLGGYIAENMSYHHGDMSLNSTIIGMTQNFIGKKSLPLLLGVSDGFGSRLKGDDCGSPRYIDLKLNKALTDALFPIIDDYILSYKFVDGKRAEPEYYVPILPYSILEHTYLPGTGWACKIWGREVFSVINVVKELINSTNLLSVKFTLPFNTHNFKGDIKTSSTGTKTVRGKKMINLSKKFSVGCYTIIDNTTIAITELPHGIWITPYKEKMMEKEFISGIKDISNSGDNIVNIIFKLKPNSLETIKTYSKDIWDGIEVYFDLYESLDENINLITPDGCVKEYNSYEETLIDWFLERKEFYKFRIERELKLTSLRILHLENIIKFCNNYKNYNLEVSEDIANKILEKEKFTQFNETKLNSPQYLETDNFNIIITSGSYDYLHNLTTREKNYKEQKDKRETKLQNLRDYYTKLNKSYEFKSPYKFPGADIWLSEIDTLENVIKIGLSQDWLTANGEVKRVYA